MQETDDCTRHVQRCRTCGYQCCDRLIARSITQYLGGLQVTSCLLTLKSLTFRICHWASRYTATAVSTIITGKGAARGKGAFLHLQRGTRLTRAVPGLSFALQGVEVRRGHCRRGGSSLGGRRGYAGILHGLQVSRAAGRVWMYRSRESISPRRL